MLANPSQDKIHRFLNRKDFLNQDLQDERIRRIIPSFLDNKRDFHLPQTGSHQSVLENQFQVLEGQGSPLPADVSPSGQETGLLIMTRMALHESVAPIQLANIRASLVGVAIPKFFILNS